VLDEADGGDLFVGAAAVAQRILQQIGKNSRLRAQGGSARGTSEQWNQDCHASSDDLLRLHLLL
jgi:hypothetical protein